MRRVDYELFMLALPSLDEVQTIQLLRYAFTVIITSQFLYSDSSNQYKVINPFD